MGGSKKAGLLFVAFGTIAVSIAAYVTMDHFAFGHPVYNGHGGGILPDQQIRHNVFAFGSFGLIFLSVGVASGCDNSGPAAHDSLRTFLARSARMYSPAVGRLVTPAADDRIAIVREHCRHPSRAWELGEDHHRH